MSSRTSRASWSRPRRRTTGSSAPATSSSARPSPPSTRPAPNTPPNAANQPRSPSPASPRPAERTDPVGAEPEASTRGGPSHDRRDDIGLGIGVVLDDVPALGGELALGRLVQPAVRVVHPEVISKSDHPVDLRAALGEHVQVGRDVGALEQSMLEPVSLAST